MLKIKFCGITNLADGLAAVEVGVDLLGFNFYPPSPRYLAPEDCAGLLRDLRNRAGERFKRVQVVGVFVNTSPARVQAVLGRLDRAIPEAQALAQLSGDEPPEDLDLLDGRAFKTLRLSSAAGMFTRAAPYLARQAAPNLLVDAATPGAYGGTGNTADWRAARLLAQGQAREVGSTSSQSAVPPVFLLLAGGLKPENVAQAVQAVQPWGVDVASGIESVPGKKDPRKMLAFVRAARQAAVDVSDLEYTRR